MYETLNYVRNIKILPKTFVFYWTFSYLCVTIKTKNNKQKSYD